MPGLPHIHLVAIAALLAASTAAPESGAAQPASAATRPTASRPTPGGAVVPRQQTAEQQLTHVLNRLAFGPRPGDVARVRAMGVDAWMAEQLRPELVADAAGDALAAHYAPLALSLPALHDRYPPPQLLMRQARQRGASAPAAVDSLAMRAAMRRSRLGMAELGGALQSARVARAVVSERQLQEVMVDFWENHFNVYAAKGPYMRHWLVAFDRDAIRPHALGRFRDLLGAVAHSPAMLFYLDNAQSRAEPARRGVPGDSLRRRGLNENYARELLELHTMGADGGYTQQDVVEVARALTGWTIAPVEQGGGFVFRRAAHDDGPKTVLGTRLPAGRGEADGEAVLDILARHPATARLIATALARRLVSDSPPAALVERAAATFRRTDGDIREVVRTIVTSPEFFSDAAYRAKVKSPFEVVVSALRAMGAGADTTPRTAQLVARLGQPIFGHLAPDGYPETGDAWINSGAILGRINFGLALAGGVVPGVSVANWPEAPRIAGSAREAQVNEVIRTILGGDASSDTRSMLLDGENPLSRTLSAGSGETPGPRPGARRRAGPEARTPGKLGGLELMVGLAIGSPEFQRR